MGFDSRDSVRIRGIFEGWGNVLVGWMLWAWSLVGLGGKFLALEATYVKSALKLCINKPKVPEVWYT